METVGTAVSLGDDTDTLAGMAGALVGARRGAAAIAKSHLQKLENGPKGFQFIEQLALRLFDRWQTR